MNHLARYLDVHSASVRELRCDAVDEDAVRAQLLSEGHRILSVRRLDAGEQARGGRAEPAPRPAAEVAIFCRELRALALAGLSVVEALEALAAEQSKEADGTSIHRDVLERLKAGRSLSSALRDVGGFSPLLVASVQSSERTSHLTEALDAYLRYDDMVGVLRRRVVSAALYPALVVSLGLVIAVFLLWVVIPRFAGLYDQMGQGAGAATTALLHLSRALRQWPWVMPLGLLTVVAAVAAVAATGAWRGLLRSVGERVPAVRRALRHFELARLYEALHLLVKGGFGFHEALVLCAGIADSDRSRQRIAQARHEVEQGVSVSRACARAGLTDEITERLLRASERGGDFGAVLRAISQRHAAAFETFVERATRVVEPVLLLGVAVLVGGMVVLLYMPVFDIAGAVR